VNEDTQLGVSKPERDLVPIKRRYRRLILRHVLRGALDAHQRGSH